MRYALFDDMHDGDGEMEVGGQRKKTKAEIEQWISDNEKPQGGIEKRDGYTVKFKNSPATYIWRNIKDGKKVKCP